MPARAVDAGLVLGGEPTGDQFLAPVWVQLAGAEIDGAVGAVE